MGASLTNWVVFTLGISPSYRQKRFLTHIVNKFERIVQVLRTYSYFPEFTYQICVKTIYKNFLTLFKFEALTQWHLHVVSFATNAF